jgi:hypothetical protein
MVKHSYTSAALQGFGDTYTSAALRGFGDTYTDAALRGGETVDSKIYKLMKKSAADRDIIRRRGGKKIKLTGGNLLSFLPMAIKGAKFIFDKIKGLVNKAKGGGKFTKRQKKIYKRLIKAGSF